MTLLPQRKRGTDFSVPLFLEYQIEGGNRRTFSEFIFAARSEGWEEKADLGGLTRNSQNEKESSRAEALMLFRAYGTTEVVPFHEAMGFGEGQ